LSFFSQPWAENYYIISKESIQDDLSIPLNPLVALGSFFTNRSLSLRDHPLKEDPTIQFLYTSAIFQQQLKTANKDDPLSYMEFQIMEYDSLLSLASTFEQPAL
jgi:hypothetical protein